MPCFVVADRYGVNQGTRFGFESGIGFDAVEPEINSHRTRVFPVVFVCLDATIIVSRI